MDPLTLEEALAKVAELEEANLIISIKNDELEKKVETLNGIIATAKTATKLEVVKPGVPTEPFEHNGKNYKWLRGSFQFPNDPRKHTAESAQADADLLNALLSIPSQKILQEVV